MKIRLALSIAESYTTIHEKHVEVEIDQIAHPSDIKEALEAIHGLASSKDMFGFDDNVALGLFIAMRESQIKKIAAVEAKADNVKEPSSWEKDAKITDLTKSLAQSKCQLDGVLKIKSPDYVPIQDQDNEPKTL